MRFVDSQLIFPLIYILIHVVAAALVIATDRGRTLRFSLREWLLATTILAVFFGVMMWSIRSFPPTR